MNDVNPDELLYLFNLPLVSTTGFPAWKKISVFVESVTILQAIF